MAVTIPGFTLIRRAPLADAAPRRARACDAPIRNSALPRAAAISP